MKLTTLTSISPVDGRYHDHTAILRPIFSEYGLMRQRVRVEVAWLQMLAAEPGITEVPALSKDAIHYLDALHDHFSVQHAAAIKELEASTNHDIKAVEYFLRQQLQQHNELRPYCCYIHFACTSEDINNLSYALMLKAAREQVLLSEFNAVIELLSAFADRHQSLAMVCRTHGQAATPSTLGREIGVYIYRIRCQLEQLNAVRILGKMNGAVGNFNAHMVAYPDLDWMRLSRRFVEGLGLYWNPHTTQIESHDYIAQYFNALSVLATILIDLCRDIWGYIALGYFQQVFVDEEVGSSTMPHKINPIDFENAEGNLGIAASMAVYLGQKLPISRWQRDLTDSTSLRNIGVVIAHICIATAALKKGLKKLQVNRQRIAEDLDSAWELLAEPIQTVMRKYGITDSYERLKDLTRGQQITQELLHDFIKTLPIPDVAKQQLLALMPATYVGNASTQVKMILDANHSIIR